MRIRFVDGADVASPDLQRSLERRLRLVVGRRAPSIQAIEVTLEALLAPDALSPGASHRCRIRARLVGGGSVQVDEVGAGVDRAIEVAAWRLDRRLDREGRQGRLDRSGPMV